MNLFLNELKAEYGGAVEAATLLGVQPATFYRWERNKGIPIKYLKKLEEATQGRFNRYMARPDLFVKD
jgi:DNA-binding transcriptional regulator YdaS (Cro superfamily)